jgi:hypothetical protein
MRKDGCLRLCAILVIFISISFSGCGDGGNPGSLRVRVVNEGGNAIANSTVVLGNPDGSMITFGTTDATGIIRFQNPPYNATVTAALECQSSSYGHYYLSAEYDVNIPEVTLMLYDCSGSSDSGTLNVNVADGLSGIVWREVTVDGLTYGRGSHSFSFYVWPELFQSDGKFSVVAVGYDENDDPVGYGLLLDQTFYDGVTVDVTIDKTDIGEIEYLMQNIPESAMEYVLLNPIRRKGVDTYVFSIWGDAPVPSSANIPYILDFGESYRFMALLSVDGDGDGTIDSEIGIQKKSLTQSSQIFDFSETPLILTNLAFSMTKPDCPTISWSGSDTSSQFINIYLSSYITSPDKSYFSYSFILPPSRTSIIFPELPETLAAFRPTRYEYLYISTYNYDIYSGYDDYLRKTDMHYSGMYEEPAELVFSYSETGISEP